MRKVEKQELIQNLSDINCNDKQILEILDLFESNRELDGIKKIKQHRCNLMNELHKQQQTIDCLDYLLYHLQGGK